MTNKFLVAFNDRKEKKIVGANTAEAAIGRAYGDDDLTVKGIQDYEGGIAGGGYKIFMVTPGEGKPIFAAVSQA